MTISIVMSSRGGSRRARDARPGPGSTTARRARGSRGSIASTVATATRRRCPNEGGAAPVGELLHPDGGERALHAHVELLAADPEVRGAEGDVVAHGRHEQLVVGVLEHDADAAADLLQVLLLDRQPADADRAGCAGWMPLRCSTSVVLPAPFGPEEGDALPAGDRQVDAEQRLACRPGRRRRGRATSSAGLRSRRITQAAAQIAAANAGTRERP